MCLKFTFIGRVPSHKNNYRIVGGKRLIRNKKLEDARNVLGWQARQACLNEGWQMLRKEKFGINLAIYIERSTYGDIDGVLTTVLDALEGIVYDNDRYCVSTNIRRVYGKVERERVEVEVFRYAERLESVA